MSNPASLGGTQIKSWNIYQKERSRAAGETSGAEGDADCGGELLDAGLEGGSGALVEGNLLAPSQVIITQVVRSKITV